MRARRGLTLLATLATFAVFAATPMQTRAAGAACANDSKYPGGVHPGGDWRLYGHDLSNTRTQPNEHKIGQLEAAQLAPAWTFSSTGAGGSGDFTGTPTVANGCVYAGSNDGWVFAMNADTGQLVWKKKVPTGGGINSSITVPGDGRVYAAVSHAASHSQGGQCTGSKCLGPYMIALDQATGALVWQSKWKRGRDVLNVLDTQPGSDVYGSPTVFDGIVFEGVSGGAAELGDESDRYAFQGSYVLIDAATGNVIKKVWTIHAPHQPEDNYAGAGIWSTPAIDPTTKMLYVGTGNPFKPQAEHANTDAVVKIDMDRTHARFGQIVGHFNGTVDQYVPAMEQLPCYDVPGNPPPYYPQGLGKCMDQDYDFGASPNLWTAPDGTKMVGAGQKSGIYFAFRAATMKQAWSAIVGPPSSVGGIVGSTAYSNGAIFGPITLAGYVWSIQSGNGGLRWASPILDGAHWGEPVSVANGIAYTVDLNGNLDAFDAATGAPLLRRPIAAGSATGSNPVVSWGGVSIARNTVYAAVGITALANGFIVAFRPGGGEGGGGGGGGGGPPPVPLPSTGNGFTAVAGPGAYNTTYATPIVLVQAGKEKLSLLNLDLQRHNIVSQTGLFDSDLAGLGQTVPVRFKTHLQSGKTYAFYCTLHPGMFGQIVAY